jgi:hypothetical protein
MIPNRLCLCECSGFGRSTGPTNHPVQQQRQRVRSSRATRGKGLGGRRECIYIQIDSDASVCCRAGFCNAFFPADPMDLYISRKQPVGSLPVGSQAAWPVCPLARILVHEKVLEEQQKPPRRNSSLPRHHQRERL